MKTEEEKAALRAKYAAQNAEKDKKREEKKAKFSETNKAENLPVVEVRVPWTTSEGMDIDLEEPPWDSLVEARVRNWRFDVWLSTDEYPTTEVRKKVVRT